MYSNSLYNTPFAFTYKVHMGIRRMRTACIILLAGTFQSATKGIRKLFLQREFAFRPWNQPIATMAKGLATLFVIGLTKTLREEFW
jgi:hypothetical protein